MIEKRTAYGFPICVMWGHWEYVGDHKVWRPNPLLAMTADQQHAENKRNGFFGQNAASETKLERAQAIAAEVRARKFPAPRRITPSEE